MPQALSPGYLSGWYPGLYLWAFSYLQVSILQENVQVPQVGRTFKIVRPDTVWYHKSDVSTSVTPLLEPLLQVFTNCSELAIVLLLDEIGYNCIM